jgi:hypothetical protein
MKTLPEDATKAYLFRDHVERLYAITRSKTGANLPLLGGDWIFEKEIVLGVQEPLAAGIDPEPALRGMRSEGYFIWPVEHIEPFGTGQ